MNKKTIAVLLTVFNRKEKTLACLRRLYAQLPIIGYEVDVYLTDDGCTDGTPEAVAAEFPDVCIIAGGGDLFWNRGMHAAWERAAQTQRYDFYLWLNDDTYIYDDCLPKLMNTAVSTNEDSIVVGTTCAVGHTEKITYGGRRRGHKGVIVPTDEIQKCEYFNGNIVLIPRLVYEKLGTNDPIFRHALGDFDYGLRATEQGIGIVVAPGLLGECDEHETLSTWCDPHKSFAKRWRAFKTPLGQNPEEFFIYERRHNGMAMACFHYATNHLRVLCPWLWREKG